MKDPQPALPVCYELTPGHFLVSSLAIAAALVLLGWLGWRVTSTLALAQWWVPVALLGGLAAADSASGLVHWAADTWGRDDCPVIGPRLLVPFRVHHVNPDDFLRRRFVDTNGEVAGVAVPILLALLAVPLDHAAGQAVAVFGLGFCGLGVAHEPDPSVGAHAGTAGAGTGAAGMRSPPRPHRARRSPWAAVQCRYCITTGWCNAPLDAIGFFRRLESAITWVTGVTPRHDDRRYEARYDRPRGEMASGRG